MSAVRLLVGTRKGAFILTSDGTRDDWKVDGPHFAGWEMYHLNGSPADPDRIYASQTSGWFGQKVPRSDDGGKTWETVGDEFAYKGEPGTHKWYDGTPHPWKFERVLAAPFSGKRSTPWEPTGSVHDFMHAKVTVADDVVFAGSFNLSRSGEQNAENVLEIHDAAIAERLAAYVDSVRARYPAMVVP